MTYTVLFLSVKVLTLHWHTQVDQWGDWTDRWLHCWVSMHALTRDIWVWSIDVPFGSQQKMHLFESLVLSITTKEVNRFVKV